MKTVLSGWFLKANVELLLRWLKLPGKLLLIYWMTVTTAGANLATDKDAVVNIGVLAYRGEDKTHERWQPTIDFLNGRLPQYQFQLIPLDLQEVGEHVARDALDFIITNTGNYIELEHKYGASRLVTLINKRLEKTTDEFGAVIFTRADNAEVNQLHDLKGRSFVAVNEDGFGGFYLAWGELNKIGINPYDDFSKLTFTGFPQSKVVDAVLNGVYVAGTFRTDSLEQLVAEGYLDLSQIKVLNQKTFANFPFITSTDLFPEWPLAKLQGTRETLARQVAIALLSMPENSSAAIAANSAGWTIPLDYKPANDLLKILNVSPYDEVNKLTLARIVSAYASWIVGIFCVLLFISGVALYIHRLNIRLKKSNLLLKDEIIHRTRLANQLEFQAMHDALTGVYNRHAFSNFFANELKRAKRSGKNFALILIDVDRFKQTNDKYGHQIGDSFLQELTRRIRDGLRDNDVLARIGGDEFAVLYLDVKSGHDVELFIARIRKAMNTPILLDDVSMTGSISLGAAIYSIDGFDAETLFRRADNKLYADKKRKSLIDDEALASGFVELAE